MSLAETIKESVTEYGLTFIPGGLGLKIYYEAARANILYFEKNRWPARISAALSELARIYGPITIIDIASEHFTAFEKISLRQYGLTGLLYFVLTATQLLMLNDLKKKKKGGEKEEKETKTLNDAVARHAMPAKQ